MSAGEERRRLPIRGEAIAPTESRARRVVVLDGEARSDRDDRVVVEEPLEIRVGGAPISITMRTPGHDDELALGFLLTEGLVPSRAAVASLTSGAGRDAHNVIEVTLTEGHTLDAAQHARAFYAASSCGVCGKSSLAALRVRTRGCHDDEVRVAKEVLFALPDAMRRAQATFDSTGGLHAAALFDARGALLGLREDVGRHNAVDKVIGRAALDGHALEGHVLMVSGRAGFEIAQKAAVARIPVLAAVSAPSSLAIEVAEELGVTLVGFLRPPRATIYAHAQRIV
jgi:FdhD protein